MHAQATIILPSNKQTSSAVARYCLLQHAKKRTLELGELRLDVARALAAVDVHLVDGRLHLHLRLFDLHLLLVCHGDGATTHSLIDELARHTSARCHGSTS
jgi:hypothetical protein